VNIQEGRMAAGFTGIVPTAHGFRAEVPGHEGRQYRVELRWEGDWMSAECLERFQVNGQVRFRPCRSRGNSTNSPCYHAVAAMIAAAAVKGHRLAFCEGEEGARRLAHFGGRVFRWGRSDGGERYWAVKG
jgi:hypothetical protein